MALNRLVLQFYVVIPHVTGGNKV